VQSVAHGTSGALDLHTNDAATPSPGSSDIGVESVQDAASLRGVVRPSGLMRSCVPPARKCGWKRHPSGCGAGSHRYATVPRRGLSDCAMTGYRGRFSILEILTMTAELERLIAAGEAADRSRRQRNVAG